MPLLREKSPHQLEARADGVGAFVQTLDKRKLEKRFHPTAPPDETLPLGYTGGGLGDEWAALVGVAKPGSAGFGRVQLEWASAGPIGRRWNPFRPIL